MSVRGRISGPDVAVTFELRHAPRGGDEIFLLGLRAGDQGRSTIRHLTVSLCGGRVGTVSTYDFRTGMRRVHDRGGALYAGTTVTARFPRASLAGLGLQPRITGFSSFNGLELQADFPVDRQGGSARS